MRVNYKELKSIIEGIDMPIYVVGHENPDYDSIGSALALTKFLLNLKKDAYLLLEKENEYLVDIFGTVNCIRNKIFEAKYVLIVVDLNQSGRLGVFEDCYRNASCTINIDHHQNNSEEADYTLSNPSITSTCEIMFNFFKEFEGGIDSNIAQMLYSGIITDTQSFMYVKSSDTFIVASELIKYGFNVAELVRKLIHERSEADIEVLKCMLDNLKFDKFHYLYIDTNEEIFSGVKGMYRVKKNMPIFLNLRDVDLLFVFFKYDDEIKVSIRSKNDIRADVIAQKFGGGGHFQAAGYTIKNDIKKHLEEIKDFLKKS